MTLFSLLGSFGNSFRAQAGGISAKGAVVLNAQTGEVLFGQNEHKKLPIASTTKIMTGLLAFEEENLDEVFTVDKNAIKVEGSSIGLREGDKINLRDLTVGMLLRSGNDAANAVAVRVSGSLENFAKKMNQRAQEIGMKNTNFVTPSGLHHDNHYSTAYDMALLAKEALKNQDFAKAVSTKIAAVEFGDPVSKRYFGNTNKLLKTYEGAIGVKTGFTKKAGRCLVTAVRRDSLTLVCVTLSASDDWNLHKKLYNNSFSKAQKVQVKQEEFQLKAPIISGVQAEVSVGLAQDSTFSHISSGNLKKEIVLQNNLYAPITVNQRVGTVVYTVDNKVVQEVPLIAKESVARKEEPPKRNLFQKIGDFFKNLFS